MGNCLEMHNNIDNVNLVGKVTQYKSRKHYKIVCKL